MGNMSVLVKSADRVTTVNVTDVDDLKIMKFLRDLLAGDMKVVNVPLSKELKVIQTESNQKITVEYPTSRNITEPSEDKATNIVPKGTKVVCAVDCPECNEKYLRDNSQAGGIVSCRNCRTSLFCEPGVNGYYKAESPFQNK